MFYTKLPDFLTFQAVFEIESLIENGAEKLCTQSVVEMNMYGLGRKRELLHVDQYFIGMMRYFIGMMRYFIGMMRYFIGMMRYFIRMMSISLV